MSWNPIIGRRGGNLHEAPAIVTLTSQHTRTLTINYPSKTKTNHNPHIRSSLRILTPAGTPNPRPRLCQTSMSHRGVQSKPPMRCSTRRSSNLQPYPAALPNNALISAPPSAGFCATTCKWPLAVSPSHTSPAHPHTRDFSMPPSNRTHNLCSNDDKTRRRTPPRNPAASLFAWSPIVIWSDSNRSTTKRLTLASFCFRLLSWMK